MQKNPAILEVIKEKKGYTLEDIISPGYKDVLCAKFGWTSLDLDVPIEAVARNIALALRNFNGRGYARLGSLFKFT